jgi:hypothetical protein
MLELPASWTWIQHWTLSAAARHSTRNSCLNVTLQLYLHLLFPYCWLYFEISNNIQLSTYWGVRTATKSHATVRKVLEQVNNNTVLLCATLCCRPLRYRDRLGLTELSNTHPSSKYGHSPTCGVVTLRKVRRKSWVYTQSTIYTRSSWNQNSTTLKPDWPQHDWTTACVIARQNSAVTFGSLPTHSSKEKFGVQLMSFFHFLKIA